MSDEPQCLVDILAQLPSDLQSRVLENLDHCELLTAARVSHTWRAASEADGAWESAILCRFTPAVAPTLAALQTRYPNARKKQLFKQLLAKHTCIRCKKEFIDGSNTPQSCSFHSGVLFSGGLMNGTALRFTCCSRRAHHIEMGSIGRDSNGCKMYYHADGFGRSAWSKAGLSPQVQVASVAGQASGSTKARLDTLSTLVDHGYEHGRGLVEWHPDHRPGVSVLPSRLLTSMQ